MQQPSTPRKTSNNPKMSVRRTLVKIPTVKLLKDVTDGAQPKDDFEVFLRGKNLLKPEGQLELTEKELQEEIARVLLTNNPQLPDNLVEYSFKERSFVKVPLPSNIITLLSIEGTCLHKESEEAIKQIEAEGWEGGVPGVAEIQSTPLTGDEEGLEDEEEAAKAEEAETEVEAEGGIDIEAEGEGEGDGDEEDKVEIAGDKGQAGTGKRPGKAKKLTNQFNFCERAALTYNNKCRELGTQTIPPSRAKFSGNVNQWIIYDAYQEDYEAQQREKERERREKMTTQPKKEETGPRKRHDKNAIDPVTIRMLQAAKIIERMINQNTYDEIAQDFSYWEDPSDEYRDGEGTLLPLWKFCYEKTKKLNVTDICWSPKYDDLFGVTFGSFDFMNQVTEGYLCLFTLKNPSFPEYINSADSGVMCLDFHYKHAYLVVVGLYDGTVLVYNVQLLTKEWQFQSNSVSNKHGGIVWQVCWGKDLPDGEMNFYSISSDGKVFNWVLMQNELAQTLVIVLYMDMDPIPGPDGNMVKITGCGSCIAFHPKEPLIFLVGTEEGNIYKCSTAYASIYLYTYVAHHMPVHRIDFNKFSPEIFISCSADWRVKIWEDNRSEPLFVFDLGCSVGDVKWAPYSSTVFAAATVDGKVHVFDLNVNKYKAICIQSWYVNLKKYPCLWILKVLLHRK
uniref:Dynein intermediate chain 2, ciliary n=1 Tax=Clastoptera arizonana TaxID=38151 RepID=A0A1B6DX00_9HEMI